MPNDQEASARSPYAGQVIRPTLELRWRGSILQQRWLIEDMGFDGFPLRTRDEWRDVPCVEE